MTELYPVTHILYTGYVCTAIKEIIVELFTATRRYIIVVASLTGYIGHII